MASAVVASMPQRIEPGTRRACSVPATSRPKAKSSASGESSFDGERDGGRRTRHHDTRIAQTDECDEETDAAGDRRAQARRDHVGEQAPHADRREHEEASPERNTAPSAVRQGSGEPAAAAAGIAVSTKKKFSPIPGACAIG